MPFHLGVQGLGLRGGEAQLVRGALEPVGQFRVATLGRLEPILVGVSRPAEFRVEGVELFRGRVLGRQFEQVLGTTGELFEVAVRGQEVRGFLPSLVADVGVGVPVERGSPHGAGARLGGGVTPPAAVQQGAVIAQQGGSRIRHFRSLGSVGETFFSA